MQQKECKDCGEIKPIENFYKKSGRKNQWLPYCKPCHLARCNRSRDKNPNTKARTKKNWQDWYSKEENREKQRERHKRYYKERAAVDPAYKLRMTMGSRIGRALKKRNKRKDGSIWEYLPYTSKQLKEHLENQFEEWMTWENHGNGDGFWNIDHIHPQSLLPYDSLEHPNFQKCWALDNLRPLSWRENNEKSDKVLDKPEKS